MSKMRDFSKEGKIGKLQPLYIDETKPRGQGHNIYWICQCDCGNLISVNSCNLQSGIRNHRMMTCGQCYNPKVDLTGKKFGKLTVIKHDDSYSATKENGWKHKWICQCDCGNIVSIFASNLTRLHTTSCGCNGRSIGEQNIIKLLQNHYVNYLSEYSFEDLKGPGGHKLRFDFAIFNHDNELIELIEFDGRQHSNQYNPWGGKETLEDRQYRDELKNQYCKNHNIKLLRFNYTQRDNIKFEDLEIGEYYD